jgi:hypothetical protein
MEETASDGTSAAVLPLGKEDQVNLIDGTDEHERGAGAPGEAGTGIANINQRITEVEIQSSEFEGKPTKLDALPNTTTVNAKEEVSEKPTEHRPALPERTSEDEEAQSLTPQDPDDISEDPVEATSTTADDS